MAYMQNYQIISRKYRPRLFKEVLGQDSIITTLKNALMNHRVAQAYLFCGSKGTGKTTMARLLAKALNCPHIDKDFEPCNTCTSCQEISHSRSLDVIEIDGASNRGIEDIRQLNETIGYAASSSPWKIYIIDEVHMLTKEAFNALLKTLEEPPKNVKFFFATTEPHKILATIVSRCQRFDLKRIPLPAIKEKLSSIANDLGVVIEPKALHQIADLAEGSLRDAEALFDQLICYGKSPITLEHVEEVFGLTPKSLLFALTTAILNELLPFAFELTQTLFAAGKDLSAFMDSLTEHIRHLLAFCLKQPPAPSLNEESLLHYRSQAGHFTAEECLRLLDCLFTWQRYFQRAQIKPVHLEILLIELIRSRKMLSLDSLILRMIALEQSIKEPAQESAPQIIETKISMPSPAPAAPAPTNVEPLKTKEPFVLPTQRVETLVRFAAVELDGALHQQPRR